MTFRIHVDPVREDHLLAPIANLECEFVVVPIQAALFHQGPELRLDLT